MRTLAATLGASVLLLFIVGCTSFDALDVTGPDRIIGSGRYVTEGRPVQGFTSLSISAGAKATVTLGGVESLEITAEDNIIPLIESTVVNGQLILGLRSNAGSLTTHSISYRIGMRDITSIVGSSAAQIEIHGIETPALFLDLSSAAAFTGSGRVDRLDMNLSSAARVHAAALASRVAIARLSSASGSLVRVSDSLTGSASSAAVLEYVGDPFVQVQTSSGATVRRVGP